jgi:O-antigen ligase
MTEMQHSRALTIGTWLLALSIFVAPFRSSAGLRALALVLAGICAFFWWRQTRQAIQARSEISSSWIQDWPLITAVVVWVLFVFAHALLGSTPSDSLPSWRGNVATPLFAAILFYAYGRQHEMSRALAVWLGALFLGLLILCSMAIAEPFAVMGTSQEPRYVNVGWLTTWLVMLAALLPLGWSFGWRNQRIARVLTMIAALAICVAAYFTYNRMVWVCLGAMFLVFAIFNFRSLGSTLAKRISVFGIGLLACAAFIVGAMIIRADQYGDPQLGAMQLMKLDERKAIWPNALEMIAESPLTGYGYGTEKTGDAFAGRFDNSTRQLMFRHPHNIVLHYAIQLGIPGAIVLITLFAALVIAFWRRARLHARNDNHRAHLVAVCGLMLICGFFLRNMVDDFFSRHAVLLLGALTGMLLGLADAPVSRPLLRK